MPETIDSPPEHTDPIRMLEKSLLRPIIGRKPPSSFAIQIKIQVRANNAVK